MTETEKAYIAGFVDGEGCISLAKNNPKNPLGSWQPVVFVTNTNLAILQRIKDLIPTKSFLYTNKRPSPQSKVTYRLFLQGNSARSFVQLLLPYLQVKREVAEVVSNFPRRSSISMGYGKGSRPNVAGYEEQLGYVKKVRQLNKRGVTI